MRRVDRITRPDLSHFNPVITVARRWNLAARHQTASAFDGIFGVLNRDVRSDFKIASVEKQAGPRAIGDAEIIEKGRLVRVFWLKTKPSVGLFCEDKPSINR